MITHDVDEAVLLSDKIIMMSNGPAADIGQVLEIDLPRPRNRVRLANNPTYNHYRQEVLSFLYERQANPLSEKSEEVPTKKLTEDEELVATEEEKSADNVTQLSPLDNSGKAA
jgi:nitrate/nitrite transport system ATP-binding protein